MRLKLLQNRTIFHSHFFFNKRTLATTQIKINFISQYILDRCCRHSAVSSIWVVKQQVVLLLCNKKGKPAWRSCHNAYGFMWQFTETSSRLSTIILCKLNNELTSEMWGTEMDKGPSNFHYQEMVRDYCYIILVQTIF